MKSETAVQPARSWRVHAAGLALLVLLAGCAPVGAPRPPAKSGEHRPTSSSHGDLPVWRLAMVAEADRPLVLLRSGSGTSFVVDAARVRRIYDVALKVAAAAGGEAPDWLLVGTSSVNAFAAYDKGRPVIGITLGMVTLLQDDEGAWGALVGHELAHFRLGHHAAQEARKETLDVGSSLAGLVLSAAGLGFGSLAADATGTLMERAFSRDDERAADAAGLDYARRAGLDPQGALRLQERLLEAGSASTLSFLSTHPAGRERIEAIRDLLGQPATSGAN